MTTPTADQIIARARVWFPAIPQASDSSPDGLDLLNEVYSELLYNVQLLSVESTVSLTADTAHYSLPTGTVRVWSARYVRSATTGDFRALNPINQDALDLEELQYLRQGSSEPIDYWTLPKSDGTPEIWLSPAAPTTTSASYPNVTVRVTKFTALTSGGANPNLPIGLPSYDAFELGLVKKWARMKGDERYPVIRKEYDEAVRALQNFRHSMNVRVNPNVRPNVTFRRAQRV